MPLNKAGVEKMCAAAQMTPALRMKMFKGFELFVADGFSPKPEYTYKRFGVEDGDFPNGAYCTIWFLARGEDFFEYGRPMLFDYNHDPWMTLDEKRRARVNKAKEDATVSLQRRIKAANEGANGLII